jgi:Xaa-Pro aminopeptidase
MSEQTESTKEQKRPLLIASESMHNADMYYATHFLATDPFIYLCLPYEQKEILIVSQMEYERAKKESSVKEVRSSLDYGQDLKLDELIVKILQGERMTAIEVPRYFSFYTAEALKQHGIDVVPVEHVVMAKARETKNEEEIRYVKKAQRACEAAMALAISAIKEAKVNGSVLMDDGGILTSERVKAFIEHALIDSGCTCDGGEPIVACGERAADPHFTGRGPLFANEPIIIDIFPRWKANKRDVRSGFRSAKRCFSSGKGRRNLQGSA